MFIFENPISCDYFTVLTERGSDKQKDTFFGEDTGVSVEAWAAKKLNSSTTAD
jgi:hypothetical protein